MKILVYGINYSPELTGIGKYTGEMVEWMASQGHDVRVITAPPYYPEWKVGERYSSWRYRREEGAATVWRCPLYVPKQPSTLKRLIHLGSFALSSFFPLMAQRRWKPDRIIGVVPTLFCTPGMRLLGKLSGARTLLHIQDYEVDAMLGLGMAGKGKGGKVAKLASAFERSGLHNVDYVSTISRSMMNKAQEKGVPAEKVIFFPNWSEVARFRDVTDQDAQALRAQLGLPAEQKIILYSGNIGEKQGLESVIDAALQLSEHPWMFVIVGQGGGKARLEKMASERGLTNIRFFPLQSYDALPALLKMADCHLVVQKRGAADAVLPSKLTNILAVGGNAVITAEAATELGQLCNSYPGIAVCVEPESVPALVTGIEQALAMPKENTVAREYAERTLEKENVLSQFIADIRGKIMSQTTLYPVVMAGGSGSRLWPLSRVLYPKQFLCLKGDLTMLQTTVNRLHGVECESPVVICNEQHRFIVAEQLRQLNKLTENIILEPAGRNTAPAIALAALAAKRSSPDCDPLMLVLAADHVIQQEEAFRDAVRAAIPYAENGKLVTFGIVPDLPETGYGYIRRGSVTPGEGDSVAFDVAQFVEKPNLETAQAYVASGEYYWNSGMFLFRAGRYLEELEKYRPDILRACEKAMAVVDPDLDFIRVDEEAFLACPEESIDYAVMERTADAVVVPMDAGWSDVGSWSSLWEISAHTPEGNVHHGDVISHKTENSYVYAESGLVTTVGVKDLVVVQTKDAVLIADRNAVQDVKKVVEQIKADGRHEHHIHREVYRPWGKYDSIDAGERYQVKRITVKPGEGLSVQMHHHRAEHWVVVAGTAKVTIDGEVKLLGENESIYIPLGATHCLENPGKIPLDLIEVRSGSYLEEDDIIRFQDRYGRV